VRRAGSTYLDASYHGLRARIVRAFQQLGYDGNTPAIYDEALGHGELVLHVPASPADLSRIAALLQHHHIHDAGYFGPGTFETAWPLEVADRAADGRGGCSTAASVKPADAHTPSGGGEVVPRDQVRQPVRLATPRWPGDAACHVRSAKMAAGY
jgi:hypothetical protein